MRENVRTWRSGDNLQAVDIVYSPDDGGYYLEKFDWLNDDPAMIYHSPIYKSKQSLLIAYRNDNFKWEALE